MGFGIIFKNITEYEEAIDSQKLEEEDSEQLRQGWQMEALDLSENEGLHSAYESGET